MRDSKIVFYCDRCGAEINANDNTWPVVSYAGTLRTIRQRFVSPEAEVDLCAACRHSMEAWWYEITEKQDL